LRWLNRPQSRRGFIAEEPVIEHPEDASEKDRHRDNQRAWVINNFDSKGKDRHEQHQTEKSYLRATPNAFPALRRLVALRRRQRVSRNAVAREQLNHPNQT
jgi:hypothetical protein